MHLSKQERETGTMKREKMTTYAALTALILTTTVSGPALAQDFTNRTWELKAGIAGITFDESISDAVAGPPPAISGNFVDLTDNVGVTFEVAYFFRPDVSIQFTGGLPPTTTVSGLGPLALPGGIADVTYGPSVLAVRKHFNVEGRISPYVGAGPSYTIIFDTKDKGVVTNFEAENSLGVALVAGVDYAINDKFGLFLDAKKIFSSSDATFTTPGGPASGTLNLDPLVVSAGVSWRF